VKTSWFIWLVFGDSPPMSSSSSSSSLISIAESSVPAFTNPSNECVCSEGGGGGGGLTLVSERNDLVVEGCVFMAGIDAIGLIGPGSRCTFVGGGGGCIPPEVFDRFAVVIVAVTKAVLVVLVLVRVDFRTAPFVLVSASFVDSVGPNGAPAPAPVGTEPESSESTGTGSARVITDCSFGLGLPFCSRFALISSSLISPSSLLTPASGVSSPFAVDARTREPDVRRGCSLGGTKGLALPENAGASTVDGSLGSP
jgi:hypothetical protein